MKLDQDKRAIVSAGARGAGAAIAPRLGQQIGRVAILDLSVDPPGSGLAEPQPGLANGGAYLS